MLYPLYQTPSSAASWEHYQERTGMESEKSRWNLASCREIIKYSHFKSVIEMFLLILIKYHNLKL